MLNETNSGKRELHASAGAKSPDSSPKLSETSKLRPGSLRALAGASWGLFFGSAAVFTIPFGVFINPIMQDTGWSRETISGGLGIAVGLIALCSPLAGRLADMIGVRRFSFLSFPAFGLALIALGSVGQSAPVFLFTAALVGILASGQTAVSYSKLIVGWFDERRGLALGVMLSLNGLGTVIVPPLSAFLIEEIGWRNTYLCLGLIIMLLGTAGAWLLVFDPPERKDGIESQDGMNLKAALGTRTFWILSISLILAVVSIIGAPSLIPSILVDRGISPMSASLVVSVFGMSIVVSRLLVGILLDRFWAPYVTMAALAAPLIGLVMLSINQSYPVAIISAILLGIGFGSEIDVLGYMTSRAFGPRHFGQIFGVTFAFFAAANGIGPLALSVALREFGISAALAGAAGLIGISICLLLLLGEKDFPYGNRPGKRLSSKRES